MKKLLSIIIVFGLTLCFTGCPLFIEKPEPEETYTGDDGIVYKIVNKNHFKFDTYNTVEVIVSDEESFILYDVENDDGEHGTGEWIRGNTSIPIYFEEYSYGDATYKHTDILICYDIHSP